MWERVEEQLSNQLPFVVYRTPKQSEVNAVFQNDKSLNMVSDFSETGFVFASFESKTAPILIRENERLNVQFNRGEPSLSTFDLEPYSASGHTAYNTLIKKAIREIESGKFRKVVLSRLLEVDSTISPITLFKRIISTYKNAFCYLWHHPEVGMWIGATPEILLQTENEALTTMSLAGTMKYERASRPIWGKKELDEQELVTDYILTALEGKVKNLQKSELETIRAGELLHLRTKITGSLKSDNLREIVGALHPTPAVCGFPKKETLDFISDNEGYDREFYAGYLGELNLGSTKSTTLYVNLRCMQKVGDVLKVYVGGGVTKDSDPEKEWQETVNKSRTMLRVLHDEN